MVLPAAGAQDASAATAPAVVAPAPPTPSVALPSDLDDIQGYEPQTQCDSTARPGAVALRALVLARYGGRDGGIGVSCASEGMTSEHADGRAWDWMGSAAVPAQKAAADAFVAWLIAPDATGRPAAMARRLGVMYVIWNRRMWSVYRASEGWRAYSGSNPHTDHVHISMGWDGAMKRTSWWTGTAVHRQLCSSWGNPALSGPVVPVAVTGQVNSIHAVRLLNGGACRVGQQSSTVLAVGQALTAAGVTPAAGTRPVAAVVTVTASGASAPVGKVLLAPTGARAASVAVPTSGSVRVTVPLGSGGSIAVSAAAGSTAVSVDLIAWVAGPAGAPLPGATPTASAAKTAAAKPVAKPAAKPVVKPVVKPVAKPVVKPATYRAVKPYVAFTTRRAAARAQIAVRVAGRRGVPAAAKRVRVRLYVRPAGAGLLKIGALRVSARSTTQVLPVSRTGTVRLVNPSGTAVRATVTVLGWYNR